MNEENNVQADVQDVSWLVRLSDADYKKLKERYADFMRFNFRLLMKQVAYVGALQDDEDLAGAIAEEVMQDLLKDKSLPVAWRRSTRKELREKERAAKGDD